ncbi:unnamed protein product [Ectocarpus sp. 4 AP-2014]
MGAEKPSPGEEIEKKLTLANQISIVHKQGSAGCLRSTACCSCWRPQPTSRSFKWIAEMAIINNKSFFVAYDPTSCAFCETYDISSMELLDQGKFLPWYHGAGSPCGPRGYATQARLHSASSPAHRTKCGNVHSIARGNRSCFLCMFISSFGAAREYHVLVVVILLSVGDLIIGSSLTGVVYAVRKLIPACSTELQGDDFFFQSFLICSTLCAVLLVQEDLFKGCFCVDCSRVYKCLLHPFCGEFVCTVPCENGSRGFGNSTIVPCLMPCLPCLVHPVGCFLKDSTTYRTVLMKQVARAQGVELTDNQRRAVPPPAQGMTR